MGADKTFRNAYDQDSDYKIWSKNSKYCKSVAENINCWIKYEIVDEGELFLVLQEDDQYWPCSFYSVFKCDVERTHMDEWKSDKINIPLSLPWLAELIWNFQRKACDTLVIYWYVSVCQEHEFYTYLLFGCLRIWPGTHTYMWKKYVMWINFRFLHMTDENKS